MGCLSLPFLEQLVIWLVVVAALVAIVRVFIPFLAGPGPLGPFGSAVMQALYIVVWAVVAIAVVVLVFDLLSCVLGAPRLLPR